METKNEMDRERRQKIAGRSRWLRLGALGIIAVALVLFGVSSFVEDELKDPGLVYTIPYGTSEIVPAGLLSAVDMPTEILFEPDQTATITVINNDTVTHLAGPFFVGPGKTYVQRFPTPGTYPITCTVNADESIVVTVR